MKVVFPVSDGGVEERALISSCESTKITTSCWTTIDRRMLEPIKKDTPCPKAKKPQQDGRRGTATIKSNPIPTKWLTYKLENSNTKDILSLLWRYWSPHQASQPGDLQKGRNSHGIWPFWLQDFQRTGETDTPGVEGTNKTLHAPRLRGKSSDSPGDWPKTTS